MTNLSGTHLNNGTAVGPQGEGRDGPSTFPTYPAYKDSGVEWLGEVPEHWVMGSLKNMAQIRNGRDYKEVESADGEYPVIGSGGQFSNATQYLYEGESVLLGRKGTIDKPLYINGRFWTVDTMFYTDISKGACAKFFYYNSLTIPFGYYSTSTALPSMTQADLLNHPAAIPTKLEQTQIARFLDHETARVDALIEEQQRLSELLKEKRQAVISHAVTKGLDPTAPMKDSGVEWLGEVPAHWNVTPLKHVVATPITDGPHETPEFIDDGVLFVSAEAVSSGNINFSKARYISREDHLRYSKKYRPQKFDIYMVKSGATTGVTAIVETDDEFNIWSPLAVVRCKPEHSPYFVLFAMRSRNFQESVVVNWSFGTQQNIGMNVIESLPIASPPADEQKKIAAFITQESEKLDSLISEGVSAVHLLQERRSALISAAVTGKIDVRNW